MEFNASQYVQKGANLERQCMAPERIRSYGVYNVYQSISFPLPLLLFQNILYTIIMGLLRLIFMPFNQPMIVSEILAGVIIGPTGLGSIEYYKKVMFSARGEVLSDTLAMMGTIYYVFVEGLKQDMRSLTHAGKKELVIALSGFSFSLLASAIFIVSLKGFLPEGVQEMGFLGFMSGTSALSFFPVIQPILAELGLLNTELGRLAMSLSMINSGLATIVGIVNQSIRNGKRAPISGIFTLTGNTAMIVFLFTVARPATLWVIRNVPEGGKVDPMTVLMFLVLTLLGAASSDAIGGTIFQVPLLLGTLIPPGPPLGSILIQKIETFIHFFLMPYFFIFNGRKVNARAVPESWFSLWFVVLAFFSACFGKFMGTLLTAKYYEIPNQASVTLAFIMCFKGIMELLVYTTWAHFGLIDGPRMAAVELGTILATAIATPLVRKLARRSMRLPLSAYHGRSIEETELSSEFHLMMCVHDEDNVPTLLNLLNASYGTTTSPIKLCLLHLVELAGRGAPILVAHDNSTHDSRHQCSKLDHIIRAFENFEKRSHVMLDPFVSISPYNTMHQDVCILAREKRVAMVIIPLTEERTAQKVARSILHEAPCSVGVLLDRRDLRRHVPRWNETRPFSFRVGTVFLGGEDDREALRYVSRMVENPDVSLQVLRCFTPCSGNVHDRERLLDEEVIGEFRMKTLKQDDVVYREERVVNVEEMMNSIRSMGTDFDVMIVGRRHPAHSLIVDALSDWSECAELGVIGDLLASSDFAKGGTSVLSIQQNRMISIFVNTAAGL